jgi:hypothetical protein
MCSSVWTVLGNQCWEERSLQQFWGNPVFNVWVEKGEKEKVKQENERKNKGVWRDGRETTVAWKSMEEDTSERK